MIIVVGYPMNRFINRSCATDSANRSSGLPIALISEDIMVTASSSREMHAMKVSFRWRLPRVGLGIEWGGWSDRFLKRTSAECLNQVPENLVFQKRMVIPSITTTLPFAEAFIPAAGATKRVD